MFKFFGNGKKTVRKNKKFATGSIRATLLNFSHQTLGSGNLRGAVVLPADTEKNDWLAVHVIDFRNSINMLWSLCVDDCKCATMTAGKKYTYAWADGVKVKKPIACSAQDYVVYLLDWVDTQTSDPKLFPEDPKVPFPKDFEKVIITIFRRYIRVFAHIALHHLDSLNKQQATPHFKYIFLSFFSLFL